jgi:hypothetical protein
MIRGADIKTTSPTNYISSINSQYSTFSNLSHNLSSPSASEPENELTRYPQLEEILSSASYINERKTEQPTFLAPSKPVKTAFYPAYPAPPHHPQCHQPMNISSLLPSVTT